MANYVLLFSGGRMPESESESAAVLKAWDAWYQSLGGAILDPGNPFTPAAKAIAPNGSVSSVPVDMMASGYSILKADSLDVAITMAQTCPVLQGGAKIAVFETFNVM